MDKADLPKLGLENIDIKIDTGAYNSSIHCHNIKEINNKGKAAIQFNLLDPEHIEYNEKKIISYNFELKKVKSSNGIEEERYAIKSNIILFGKKHKVLFTLTDRTDMRYPILIGRNLLRKKFLVDVSKKNLSYKQKIKNEDSHSITK